MSPNSSDCPFCEITDEHNIIKEKEEVFAIYDKYPVNEGHSLIIPKTHEPNYFDLPQPLQNKCWGLVNEIQQFLEKRLNTSQFNISVNVGRRAGQTVHHAHIHLIPRFEKGQSGSSGGLREVVPGKETG